MKILIDTNIILDIIQKREPFFSDSFQAIRKAIEAGAECLFSVSAATDLFYVLRKALKSYQEAKKVDRTAFSDRHLCECTGCRYSYCAHALYARL